MSTYRDEHELQYTHARINRFFSAFGLPGAVSYAESIIEAAVSQKVWKHAAPCSLLFFIESFEELLSAAYKLYDCYEKQPEVLIAPPDNGVPDVTNFATYVGKLSNNAWESFPRTLTAKQFHDPYRAIYKCCKRLSEGQWKTFLKDLTEYALDRDTINLAFPSYNMFAMRRRMLMLIEACHLVHVRISNEKEISQPKNEVEKDEHDSAI